MQRDRRYWFRLLRLLAAALFGVVVLLPFVFGGFGMWSLTRAACADFGGTPADYGFDYEDVVIESREAGGMHRGFYIPSQNGAHILFPPSFSGGRDNRLAEIAPLAWHGYGILTFESRSCMGRVNTLGYREVEDVGGALDWLLARPGVDPDRIGIHGFSSSGATAIMAAAQMPALRAVVAEGGYHALGRSGMLGQGGNVVETVMRWGAEATYLLATGISINQVSPLDVIDQIAPRPVLLVYGSAESSLPGAYQQMEAGGDNVALWVVEDAWHGGYIVVAPEAYARRMVEFFDTALAIQ